MTLALTLPLPASTRSLSLLDYCSSFTRLNTASGKLVAPCSCNPVNPSQIQLPHLPLSILQPLPPSPSLYLTCSFLFHIRLSSERLPLVVGPFSTLLKQLYYLTLVSIDPVLCLLASYRFSILFFLSLRISFLTHLPLPYTFLNHSFPISTFAYFLLFWGVTFHSLPPYFLCFLLPPLPFALYPFLESCQYTCLPFTSFDRSSAIPILLTLFLFHSVNSFFLLLFLSILYLGPIRHFPTFSMHSLTYILTFP